MEPKEDKDNKEEQKSKTIIFKPMKMQDFFKISDTTNENKKNKEESKKNSNDNKIISSESNNKNSLYKFLYESTLENDEEIQKQIKSIKNEEKKREPTISNINISGSLIYIEPINIFIDDENRKYAEMIIQNYECRFNFDEKVLKEFSRLVHFTPKYFEFPIFYAFKGKFDKETNVTTITLKDYRSFKLLTKDNSIYKKIFDSFNNKVDNFR